MVAGALHAPIVGDRARLSPSAMGEAAVVARLERGVDAKPGAPASRDLLPVPAPTRSLGYY
eukprot:scaffold57_cov33-Tisochrysis_lutea.AAC.1